MNRIFVFLLMVGAVIGLVVAVKDYQVKQKEERNVWPERVADLLRRHSGQGAQSLDGKGDETSFFQMLSLVRQSAMDGFPISETVQRAAEMASASGAETALLAEALHDALKRATELGILDDPANLLRMERGERPLASKDGWDGEPVSIGHKLPPLLGPELSVILPNFVLMPEAARDLQSDKLPSNAKQMQQQLLNARMITPETAQAIHLRLEETQSRSTMRR